jgi:tetratricopeptide (TPR) repeat protein
MAPGLAAEVEEILDEVRDRLRQLRENRARKRGRPREIDVALGRKVGYCSTLLKEGAPPPGEKRPTLFLGEVVALLLELGMDPRQTLSGLFEFDLELYLLELAHQNVRQVDWLKERRRDAAPLEAGLGELAEMAEEMEQLRLSDPPAGKVKGFAVLATLDCLEASEERARVECEAWGALAGLQRMTATFSSGAYCLLQGLEVAKKWKLVECEAKLLRRCCYLLGNQGDYEKAVSCANAARELYFRELDIQGIGRSLVDTAIMLRRCGNHGAALRAHKLALGVLSKESWLERSCAYQSMGLAYVESEDIDQARACLAEMKTELAGFSSVHIEISMLSLEGEIALKQDDLRLAEKSFRRITDVLLNGSNAPRLVLGSIRLAQTLLSRRKLEELRALVGEMMPLPVRFKHNKLVFAAINEFLIAGVAGDLSEDVVNNIYLQLGGHIPFPGAPKKSKTATS